MNCEKSEWYGFPEYKFEFDGKSAVLVMPDKKDAKGRWLFKTEYFGAFPSFEIEMLKRGYSVAHVKNQTRWRLESDTDRQARFAEFLHKEFGLNQKCMPVGMSCGGMQAIYLAAKYPEIIAALYLDAPVLNFLSFPCGIGTAKDGAYDEFKAATGMDIEKLINYRKHPIDMVDSLIKHKIPTLLVCGDSDSTVPYMENGDYLAELFEASDVPFKKIIKIGCEHHPHGLEDPKELIEFAETYYR